MPFILRSIQCTETSGLQDQQYMFGVRSFTYCRQSVDESPECHMWTLGGDAVVLAIQPAISSQYHFFH